MGHRAGQRLHHHADWDSPGSLGGGPISVHGMAGEVETGDFFLHGHALLGGEVGLILQMELYHFGGPAPGGEEVKLALDVLSLVAGEGVKELLIGIEKGLAAEAHRVKGPGPDEALQDPLVQVGVQHSLAEVLEGAEGAALVPLGHDLVGDAPANAL